MYKHIINHSDLSKLGDMIMLDLFGFIQNKMWKDVGGGGWLVMMPCKIVPVIYTESQKINQLNEVAVYLYQVAHITCKSFVQVLKINAANLDDGTACLTFDSLCLPSFFFFPNRCLHYLIFHNESKYGSIYTRKRPLQMEADSF